MSVEGPKNRGKYKLVAVVRLEILSAVHNFGPHVSDRTDSMAICYRTNDASLVLYTNACFRIQVLARR